MELWAFRCVYATYLKIALCRYGVSGYPTIKFFPMTSKDGEDYEGGRDIDSFVTFINEKCGTSRDAKGQLTSAVSSLNFNSYSFNKVTFMDGPIDNLTIDPVLTVSSHYVTNKKHLKLRDIKFFTFPSF
jgi:hypothetical protein